MKKKTAAFALSLALALQIISYAIPIANAASIIPEDGKQPNPAYADPYIAASELAGGNMTPTTRLEFCHAIVDFLHQYGFDIDAVEPYAFADTDDRDVGIAAALGITRGTNAAMNLFSPDSALTREQAAVLLDNALGVLGKRANSSRAEWADAASISEWAVQPVSNVYSCGIIIGTDSKKLVFSPKTPYMHEQSILALQRMWKYLAPEVSEIEAPPATEKETKAEYVPARWCTSAEEAENWIVENIKKQTAVFELSYPSELPADTMSLLPLLRNAESKCEDYIRWGRGASKFTQRSFPGYVLYRYSMVYLTTPEKDAAAFEHAESIVESLDISGKSTRKKIDAICNYVKTHLQYDRSLTIENAHDTFAKGKGTCLGLTIAIQMMLTKAGVNSKAVAGLLNDVSHIWLIVEIDGYWYRIEPSNVGAGYLKPAIDGGTYKARSEFKTKEFLDTHPISSAI
jgi:hypothetical protein